MKVINIKDPEFPVLNQIPSTHFVRSICFSENGTNFAMLQVDGILKIFKIIENNPAPQLIKTLTGPKSDINGNLKMSWKDRSLGVLYGGNVLRVYETENWTIKSEMSLSPPSYHFELLSSSAALISTQDGYISTYSIPQSRILKSSKYSGNLDGCSIAGANEQFSCIFDPEKSDLFSIKMDFAFEDLEEVNSLEMSKKNDRKMKKEKKARKSFIVDETMDSDENQSEDDEEEDVDNLDDRSDISQDEIGDDNDNSGSDLEESLNGSFNESLNQTVYTAKRHPVIQPCCTPWRNLQRYLAYTNVGFITARRQLDDESENAINYDIEFMDRNAHNPIRFSDSVSYSMAALNEKGAVFASEKPGSWLKFVSFENPEDSWNITAEDSILVGVNSANVFVVNSRGIINIFTLSGLLRSSATCPGRPISLICPDGKEIYLFTEDSEGILCYRLDSRCGGVSRGSQGSRVLLRSSSSSSSAAAEEDNQIIWCGLSFSGVLGAFTSSGKLLILLTGGSCDRWTEILDTSKILSDKFEQAWPVYFDVNVLSAVTCKISDSYPDPYPAPHVIDFKFKIPELSSDDSLEE